MTIQTSLARIVAVALFVGVIAGIWDASWHSAIGRDTIWEPPHLLLYSAVIVAIVTGLYGWRKTKEKIWARLAAVLVLIPISAPFDNLWHSIYGVEDLTSPLVIWSPPHLVLIFTIIGSLIMILPHLRREKDPVARRFFGALVFGAIFSLVTLLVAPFDPHSGYIVLGFYGAGFIGFATAILFLAAEKWFPGLGSTTSVVLVTLALQSFGFGGAPADDIIFNPHQHPPDWLASFSLLLPAAIIDLFPKIKTWIKGGLVGLLSSLVVYSFVIPFLDAEFQYAYTNSVIAIIMSTVGGLVAGVIVSRLHKPS